MKLTHIFVSCLRLYLPNFFDLCQRHFEVAHRGINFLATERIPSQEDFAINNIEAFLDYRDDRQVRNFLMDMDKKYGQKPWTKPENLTKALTVQY